MQAGLIGARIRAKREELGFSQEAVSRHLGFKDRQTLSTIETGERRVSAEELLRFSEVLAAPLDWFTDPFLLAGEGRFSWRQNGVPASMLDAYEQDAGRLIALYRALGPAMGRRPPLLRPALALTKASSYEDAAVAGERFAAEFKLGDAPAWRLAAAMEELGILVLMVDAIPGVSGAACRLPELDAVLINRREVPGRRHYDLAHELFHILTWDGMPPERLEDVSAGPRGRVEQLADTFASALLMPSAALARLGSWGGLEGAGLVERLNLAGVELGVTASALRWRLAGARLLPKATARGVDEGLLRHNGQIGTPRGPVPPLFSKPFAELVATAVDAGRLSGRRAASLLGLPVDDLAGAFEAHGVVFDPGI